MAGKTAILLGGTGETGKEVLRCLVETSVYGKIISVARRMVRLPKDNEWDRVEQRVVDFEKIQDFSNSFSGADVAFCCLGTTRRRSGAEGFVKVDHDYVVGAAKLLKDNRCPEFHLLTSKGSNVNSWFLYPSTKGKVEEAVKEMKFASLSIYRPGLLKCDRQESRLGEKFFRWLADLTDKNNSWSVSTSLVAKSMVVNSLKPSNSGVEVLDHCDILKITNKDL